jgi:hypothetical protein
MAFIPTPNGAKVIMPFNNGVQNWSNTMWFTKPSFTTSDLEDLVAAVLGCLFNALDATFSNTVQYGPAIAYDMRTQDGEVVVGTESPQGGEGTGDPLTPSHCCLLTLRTSSRGRSARGRLYVGGWTENNVTARGNFATGVVNGLEAFGDCLLTTVASLGWTWVVRSIQQDGVKFTTAVTRPVTLAEVRSIQPTTQRRRIGRI